VSSREPESRDSIIEAALGRIVAPRPSATFFEDLRRLIADESGSRTSVFALPYERRARPTTRRRWAVLALTACGAAVLGGTVGATVLASSGSGPDSDQVRVVTAAVSSPVLAFAPAEGWNTVTTSIGPFPPDTYEVQVAWAANVAFAGGDVGQNFPSETLQNLPTDGIAFEATLADSVATPDAFPVRELPLDLSSGPFFDQNHAQPARNVSQIHLHARVNDHYVAVRVYFGTTSPSEEILAEAQAELDRLLVPDESGV
jgi:hypothetical protein